MSAVAKAVVGPEAGSATDMLYPMDYWPLRLTFLVAIKPAAWQAGLSPSEYLELCQVCADGVCREAATGATLFVSTCDGSPLEPNLLRAIRLAATATGIAGLQVVDLGAEAPVPK